MSGWQDERAIRMAAFPELDDSPVSRPCSWDSRKELPLLKMVHRRCTAQAESDDFLCRDHRKASDAIRRMRMLIA